MNIASGDREAKLRRHRRGSRIGGKSTIYYPTGIPKNLPRPNKEILGRYTQYTRPEVYPPCAPVRLPRMNKHDVQVLTSTVVKSRSSCRSSEPGITIIKKRSTNLKPVFAPQLFVLPCICITRNSTGAQCKRPTSASFRLGSPSKHYETRP